MPICSETNSNWREYLNVSKILIPPKEFCDLIKPKLDTIFGLIESDGTYGIRKFKSLEKNTIVSIIYDYIYRRIIDPEVIQNNSKMVDIVLDTITLSGFRDLQISFAIVHYTSHIMNITYERNREDIGCIRSFSKNKPHITCHNTEAFVNRGYEQYYFEIENNSFNAPQNNLTDRAISLCKYTKENLYNEMDDFISKIVEEGERKEPDTRYSTAPISWERSVECKEENTIKNKGENKMVKVNNVGISTMNGTLVVKNAQGKYVSYDKEKGMLQEHMPEFVISADNMVTVIPAIKVAVGDIITVIGKLLYVKSIDENGGITAVDFANATEEVLVQRANEFNISYYNKLVNITQMTQPQEKLTAAEAQQLMTLLFVEDSDITDMGRMVLLAQLQNVEPVKDGESAPKMDMMNPMMLMAMKDGKGSKDKMMKMMMISQLMNTNGECNNLMTNPMILASLMSDTEGSDDKMMKMLMMSQMAGNQANGINPMMLMMMGK